MKACMATVVTALALIAAAPSAGAANVTGGIGRWGAVEPQPRLWVAPDGAIGRWAVGRWAVGRWAVKPAPRAHALRRL